MRENQLTYGAVSFSGITEAGPFYEQIWAGRKRQTMREPRKDGRPHVKIGHTFKMFWKTRISKEKKPVHFIGSAECTRYELVNLVDVWDDKENAIRDGFIDLDEFRGWFFPRWKENPELVEQVVKAARDFKAGHEIISMLGRSFGQSVMRDFIEARYFIISWSYPLLDFGEKPLREV